MYQKNFQTKLDLIWEFAYIGFLRGNFVLRLDHTDKDLNELFNNLDEEFENMEKILLDALAIVEENERIIELSKLN